MGKDFSSLIKGAFTALALLSLQSCIVDSTQSSSTRDSGISDNSQNTVDYGKGRIIPTNPVVQTGTSNLPLVESMGKYLQVQQVDITTKQYLRHDCMPGTDGEITDCFKVLNAQSEDDLQNTSRKWAYDTASNEFLQVQGFYHTSLAADKFHETIFNIFSYTESTLTQAVYESSIPSNLFTTQAHWDPNKSLVAYTNCGVENNAYYNPSTFTLCFGQVSTYPTAKFIYDPSVIYHESGHAFTQILINARNSASSNLTKIDLGTIAYDEAGAINEAISDFYSFFINKRRHFSEWALGLFYSQSRPLDEDDSLHPSGISKTVDGRLSYPRYINYDPNDYTNYDASNPPVTLETVHYTGQIASHFFMALLDDTVEYCSFSEDVASKYIYQFIVETLAEYGDLTAKGSDSKSVGFVNLNADASYEWATKVNPPNFYTFFQKFSKYVLYTLNKNYKCNGMQYPQDRLESLLDQYGLLLFSHYNENGDSLATGIAGDNTSIKVSNRVQTNLIPKSQIIIDPTTGANQAYVTDDQQDIVNAIAAMKQSGQITEISSLIGENAGYNNGNVLISPGEIVGITLNLYNNSNTTMGGVQILANDWDHTKVISRTDTGAIVDEKPCNNLGDSFPTTSEGGVFDSTGAVGDCSYITRSNGEETETNADGHTYKVEELAPICLVLMTENDSSVWGTQEAFRKSLSLPESQCLGGADDTRACFIRAIKGADQAVLSKISPKTNWYKTMTNEVPERVHESIASNLIFFEVNPKVPPGTEFDCRFRVRFSNCKDCYYNSTTGDNYADYEYSGADPFQIVHFRFPVTE